MSNFTILAIVVTCLFVTAVLIVDHIEVARHNRITTDPAFKQLLAQSPKIQSFGAYCNEIGLAKDCSTEELVAASEDWERITKILKTM